MTIFVADDNGWVSYIKDESNQWSKDWLKWSEEISNLIIGWKDSGRVYTFTEAE